MPPPQPGKKQEEAGEKPGIQRTPSWKPLKRLPSEVISVPAKKKEASHRIQSVAKRFQRQRSRKQILRKLLPVIITVLILIMMGILGYKTLFAPRDTGDGNPKNTNAIESKNGKG